MKELQAKIRDFCKKNNMNAPVEHQLLDTLSELGEVAKEVLKMSNYGRRPIKKDKKAIESELGDVFYSLITIANSFDVDLEEALEVILKKYKKRIVQGGSADSINEKSD